MILALELEQQREEGREEAITENIRSLIRNAKITPEKAMKLLGIAPQDFAKYAALI